MKRLYRVNIVLFALYLSLTACGDSSTTSQGPQGGILEAYFNAPAR